MLGGYISDLEVGDVFKPYEYVLTSMMASEYAHGVEENHEWFHSDVGPGGRQIRPPTMVHADKMRLLEHNCDKERRLSDIKAKDARIHYEYEAVHCGVGYVGEHYIVSGKIIDKYERRGRTYLCYELEVHTSDGRKIVNYRDKTVMKFRVEGDKA